MLRIHNFNDKSGEVLVKQGDHEWTFDMYGEDKSNVFLATVWKHKGASDPTETEYQLQWFFVDESHGKRMLGLQKNFDGKRENCLTEIKKMTIYKNKCANWKKILMMFAQAFDEIEIEIKNEEE